MVQSGCQRKAKSNVQGQKSKLCVRGVSSFEFLVDYNSEIASGQQCFLLTE